ncbi:WecB/TagA/CpsF family glycosyltransferase [Aquimarina agarivorans]|uniref:WecB/TagA/CpsF family glycosyltransferase n=1 Tax=Aquimarina agarivorans TaxID=980584 RepID=UPI000248E855|nr:WecB/TagA/CpsF family glycosyltransferase [Aquimarina agarivorans]
MNLLGYNIEENYPKFPVKKKTMINTINPHSYCVSKSDSEFEQALKKSDVLLPDGIGIVWAAKVLRNKKISRITGFDIFKYSMNYLNNIDGTCFFLGASEETLAEIEQRLKKDYPNVKVDSYSPPYKENFTASDSKIMCQKVNDCNPDILFVGMTAPKQEKWAAEHLDKLNVKVVCSIGAVFDFYSGRVKRPSKIWLVLGLEWLGRFMKEPKRLAKRNLISAPKFIAEVISNKFTHKELL